MPTNDLHIACGYGQDPDWPRAEGLLGAAAGAAPGADTRAAARALCTETDDRGWLALHWAAEHGAPVRVVGPMLQLHPQAAAAKARGGYLPLHLALGAYDGKIKASAEVIGMIVGAFPQVRPPSLPGRPRGERWIRPRSAPPAPCSGRSSPIFRPKAARNGA